MLTIARAGRGVKGRAFSPGGSNAFPNLVEVGAGHAMGGGMFGDGEHSMIVAT